MLGDTETGVKFEKEKERVFVHTKMRSKDFEAIFVLHLPIIRLIMRRKILTCGTLRTTCMTMRMRIQS